LLNSSVRSRLFAVIAGMALLASMAIGVTYVATETERVDVRADTRSVAELYDLTVRLSNSIRDQEAAVDDYLLSRNPDVVGRYRTAVEDELRLAERMRDVAAGASEYPGIRTALDALTTETRSWRDAFAQPAVAAVDRGSTAEISKLTALVANDQEPTLAGVGKLIGEIAAAETSVAARDEALIQARGLVSPSGSP